MDGNGVNDVVIADTAGNIGYVDVLGAPRPGLLQSVQTANLVETDVQYQDMPTLSRAAFAAGQQWLNQSAASHHVVTQLSSTDLTPNVGAPPVTTTYIYRDPMYDARDRTFIGFTSVEGITAGDSTAPQSHVKTTFYQSYCDDGTAYAGRPCPESPDYQSRALRGLPILTETYGDMKATTGSRVGPALSTVHRTFTVQSTYLGLDQRHVWRVWTSAMDTYSYNGATPANLTTGTQLADVMLGDVPATDELEFYVDSAGAHTQILYFPDPFGASLTVEDLGQVNSTGQSLDGVVLHTSEATLVPLDTTDYWIWRPSQVSVSGISTNQRHE